MELAEFIAENWPAMICLVAGLALIIFEMFTPGFRLPGILGIVLLLLSVVLTADTFSQALVMVLVILAVLTVVLVIVIRSATRGRIFRSPLVLKSKATGYLSVDDMHYYVNKTGVAASLLRPSGIADIEGVKLDVVTQGEYIQKGTAIRVIKVEGRRIVVEAVRDEAAEG